VHQEYPKFTFYFKSCLKYVQSTNILISKRKQTKCRSTKWTLNFS